MGWTTYARYDSPKTTADERAEVIRLYTGYSDEARFTADCLMASKVGTTWYLAIRLTPKAGYDATALPSHATYVPDADGSYVWCGVILTSRHDGEWGYKDLTETMGPTQSEAPLKLLAMLSPLRPGVETYARAWRERVRAHHAARRARPKIRAGDRIVFPEPIEFQGGGKARVFQAFEHRKYPGARARVLFNTLDTRHAMTVRMTAAQIAERKGRLMRLEETVEQALAETAEAVDAP